ncbi:AMP-dependent synthetase and ligase [Mycena galericulata]|nr:AMP-dependent synthetase and ligase [Mycena galericulata]
MRVMDAEGVQVEGPPSKLNGLQDRALVLHTSGTSGIKKVVPYSLLALVVGTCAVVESWDLRASDVNLNMMPLFHVGGIVRNLLAPIFSGGGAIMCAGFDAVAFWSLAKELRATWYYAAPTIHHAILASHPPLDSLVPARDLRIRMIANAAGGLLPSLASELQRAFGGAAILPSYGMTECMPITSPPSTYALSRPGTSGLPRGPHLSIRPPLDITLPPLPACTPGAICVRGLPTFEGYEVSPDPSVPLDRSAFTEDEGWFDTGDVGYVDADGWLFITGRSKEIINKGGEVVSPFEVEEAVGKAAKCFVETALAFSVAHDVLQEAIGVVIVPVPGKPRIGLGQLHDLLRDHLHPSKWPSAIVYMDDLPKNSAGKPLRINLATRLGLTSLSDATPALQRHFEAHVPAPNAALATPIRCAPVAFDVMQIEKVVRAVKGVADVAVRLRADGAPEAFVSAPNLDNGEVKVALESVLNGYAIPDPLYVLRTPLLRKRIKTETAGPGGDFDFAGMEAEIAAISASAMSETALAVRDIVAGLLGAGADAGRIGADSDFFLLGGNSLLLGKLAHQIRKGTGTNIPIATLFTHSTIKGIAALIDDSNSAASKTSLRNRNHSDSTRTLVPGSPYPTSPSSPYGAHTPKSRNQSEATLLGPSKDAQKARGQHHPLSLIVQAIPFLFFYPLKAALTWSVLLLVMAELAPHVNGTYWERILSLLTSIVAGRLAARIISPIAAIIFKWLVIGRYKPGTYRLWSTYYLRYWIVDQALRIAGRGIFTLHPSLTTLYYRLLGARIGKGVRIAKHAHLAELDLLTLHDGCALDDGALVRGFCVEREGYFTLAPISVGRYAVVNTYTQIAPGAVVSDGTVYGPHASTRDKPQAAFAACSRPLMPEPHMLLKLFVAYPVILFVYFVSYLPWFAVVYLMINSTTILKQNLNALESVVAWFASPTRILFHALSRIVRALLSPLIQLALGVLVKRLFGLNEATQVGEQPTQMALLRRFINGKTLSRGALRAAFGILGTHYEVVSVVFRAMGAKVGRRVYWPGSGVFPADPELLEIGDDVVFGSRSEIFTSDRLGTAKVVIGDGAMIADRVVLLPGARIGKMTVMGSGALALRDTEYKDGSMWLGQDCLEDGTTKDLTRPTITPFGRAFYARTLKTPFFVFPYPLVLGINLLVTALSAAYWSISAVAAAQVLRLIDHHVHGRPTPIYHPSWFRAGIIYGLVALCFVVVLNLQALLAIAWLVATKWLLIGRRRDGEYAWDQSSYCQRWQLHLVLSRFAYKGYGSGGVLAPLTGSAYFVWYLRAMGARVGRDCGVYPGGRAGLMTEPDLVKLGDNVSLDDCSVVAHINSRGNFALNSLQIGNGCAMRTGARLLSGASMEDGSMLCEHTLLTSGDVADAGAVYSGWPAKDVRDFDDERWVEGDGEEKERGKSLP